MIKSKTLLEPYVCSYCSHVERYGVRFYNERVDIETPMNELPLYVGAGMCTIIGGVAYISRVTFKGDNKLDSQHMIDGIDRTIEHGAHTMIYERHKPGGGVIQYHYSTIDKKCYKRVVLK